MKNDIKKALEGAQTVLHIVSILYSTKIVELGPRDAWYILVHTTGRYSKFKSAASHYIKIEEDLISRFSHLTILRPTMIYGSHRDRNMWKLIAFLDRYRFFPVFGNGKNLMQPVTARDLAKTYLKVFQNKEKTFNQQYNLAGKNAVTYGQILGQVSQNLGKKITFIHLPLSLSIVLAFIYNFLFGKRAHITVEQVMRMGEDKDFSNSKANAHFAYDPVSFEEGIKREVDEYKIFKTRCVIKNV